MYIYVRIPLYLYTCIPNSILYNGILIYLESLFCPLPLPTRLICLLVKRNGLLLPNIPFTVIVPNTSYNGSNSFRGSVVMGGKEYIIFRKIEIILDLDYPTFR